jgi:hypothetical protein
LPSQLYRREYVKARKYAADETGLPIATFLEVAPFGSEEVLSGDFLPEDA